MYFFSKPPYKIFPVFFCMTLVLYVISLISSLWTRVTYFFHFRWIHFSKIAERHWYAKPNWRINFHNQVLIFIPNFTFKYLNDWEVKLYYPCDDVSWLNPRRKKSENKRKTTTEHRYIHSLLMYKIKDFYLLNILHNDRAFLLFKFQLMRTEIFSTRFLS